MDFLAQLGVLPSILVFTLAAAVTLWAGRLLEREAQAISKRTGLGELFAGTILLAVATSLPEVATSTVASLRGDVDLAVNNLLGGVVIQTMVLALADMVSGPKALTSWAPSFGILIQGVGLLFTLALAVVVAAVAGGEGNGGPLLAYSPALISAAYLAMQWVTLRKHDKDAWRPAEQAQAASHTDPAEERQKEKVSAGLLLRFAASSAAVLVAGFFIVVSAERLSEHTGKSQGFLGFTLVAFTTSLPEVSTTIAAARRGHGASAASNIFGSNGFDVALLGLVAAISSEPLFAERVVPSVLSAALGMLLTSVYLLGMLERRDRSILKMGVDSVAVLLLGFLGMWLMHRFGT